MDQSNRTDEKNQNTSQQAQTSQHKDLTSVVNETPEFRLAEPVSWIIDPAH
jgi:hypothetical protein